MKPVFSISVRDLVSFVLRTGDLAGGGGQFVGSSRALEGTRGHQRVQRSRPSAYQPEVVVCGAFETDGFTLEVQGRIDGVLVQENSVLIEEIKTVRTLREGPADPLHWAQAKVYAHLFGMENPFEVAAVQITYLEIDSGQTNLFQERFTAAQLEEFFRPIVAEYQEWVRGHLKWIGARNVSIKELSFPFSTYRPGQRALAVAVYRTIKRRGKLFAEAPTGIGKTMSVLFPSIKAMGEGKAEKIFYLTAKTIGRTAAEKAVADLRSRGLRVRAVTLTARDKICFNNGEPCDVKTCPFAIGYYDRIKGALKDALQCESFTRPEIEAVARKHQVCPFELSLDLSQWVDLIICDYNYAFDPSASLKRFFSDERHDFAILIDEAHNLVDRARDMFSATLDERDLTALRKGIEDDLPSCSKALKKLGSTLAALPKDEGWVNRGSAWTRESAPEKVGKAVKVFLKEAELWLVRNEPAPFRAALLEAYFRALSFQRVLDGYDGCYLTIYEHGCIQLFCVDPSRELRKALERIGSAIFFSATLRPMDYFRAAVGGDQLDEVAQLGSPFPAENLEVLVQNRINTRFRARAQSYDAITGSIAAMAGRKQGNYLVYFPSYEYLREVLQRFRAQYPQYRIEEQTTAMTEAAREELLSKFQAEGSETLIGFAVLGGIFGEGIDLVGERLIGVAIVGVGLPQLGLERDLIREYHQRAGRPGFEYAYTFPGMNRVLQAVGRVIRSEQDRGVVLLIDDRFATRTYMELFPEWWRPRKVTGAEEISSVVREFFDGGHPPVELVYSSL